MVKLLIFNRLTNCPFEFWCCIVHLSKKIMMSGFKITVGSKLTKEQSESLEKFVESNQVTKSEIIRDLIDFLIKGTERNPNFKIREIPYYYPFNPSA